MNLRRYLIPTGYWISLGLAVVWLGSYLRDGDLAQAALAIALLALAIALRAFGGMKDLQMVIAKPKQRRAK